MKALIIAAFALLVGAWTGFSAARGHFDREIRAHFQTDLAALANKQEYTCHISLAALNRLELGKMDEAKQLLAFQVAMYHGHPLGQTQAQREKLLARIEASRANSEILRSELSKEAERIASKKSNKEP